MTEYIVRTATTNYINQADKLSSFVTNSTSRCFTNIDSAREYAKNIHHARSKWNICSTYYEIRESETERLVECDSI